MQARLLVAVTLLATACSPRPAAEPPQQTATNSVVSALPGPLPPVGKRLSALKPRHPAVAVDRCPLAIEPGIALGPVELGYTRADLEALGLPITVVSAGSGPATFLKVGMIDVQLLEGKVIEAWIDDLRKAPDCVTFRGAAVRPTVPREQLEATVGSCTATPGRTGGAFERWSLCRPWSRRLFADSRATSRG